MFERQQELEREQGFRGPATRYFAPIEDRAEALLVIRDMSLTLLFVSAVFVVLLWRAGWSAILFAGILAVPSILLLLTRSRSAAVCLAVAAAGLAVWALIRSGPLNLVRLLVWFCVLAVAQRAFRAAFKAHGLGRVDGEKRGAA